MKRKGLSVQVKTGKKHRPTAELLPRMKNFHWHSIYQMALLDPWVWKEILLIDFQFTTSKTQILSQTFPRPIKNISSKTHKKYQFQDTWTLLDLRLIKNIGSKTHEHYRFQDPQKNIGSKTHRIYRFQDPWKLPVRRPLPAPRPMTAFLRMDRPWVLEQVFFHGSWTRYLPVAVTVAETDIWSYHKS